MSKRSAPSSGRAISVFAKRLVLDQGENGIGGVRLLLVGEVDPGDEPVEQAPAKTETSMWGACGPSSGPGTGPGLIVVNSKRPSESVAHRPNPVKPSSRGTSSRVSSGARSGPPHSPARSRPARRRSDRPRRRTPSRSTGSPPDGPARRAPPRPRRAARCAGTGRSSGTGWAGAPQSSIGVASRPRRTMSYSYASAQSGTVRSWS